MSSLVQKQFETRRSDPREHQNFLTDVCLGSKCLSTRSTDSDALRGLSVEIHFFVEEREHQTPRPPERATHAGLVASVGGGPSVEAPIEQSLRPVSLHSRIRNSQETAISPTEKANSKHILKLWSSAIRF